ncbi:hypothetical protein KKB43_03270 [Patescibacteria group bacterium]|nr:hypothetical protein [Patescibacteria group bacterium]MBU4580015.1 hypothetical protein [Patescibacteria group bacterium]
MRNFGEPSIFNLMGFYTAIGAKIGLAGGLILYFFVSETVTCNPGVTAGCGTYLANDISRLIMLPVVILFGDKTSLVSGRLYGFVGFAIVIFYYFLIGSFLGYLYGKYKK